MKTTDALTGYSLFIMLLLALMASFGWPLLASLAGCFAWFAASRLFTRLLPLQRIQVLVMLAIGAAGLIFAAFTPNNTQVSTQIGTQINSSSAVNWWLKALEGNQGLLSMLLSVSFLRLVAITESTAKEKLPLGRWALWKMLLGVHAFGAVINFSAMIIMADRLAAKQTLSPRQALVITRGFTLAAHWSPFFASMGVVLISAPGASLWKLMPVGLILAAVGLGIAGWLLIRHPEAEVTTAYPMHWQALTLPFLLAVSVLGVHLVQEDIPVLTLVSVLSLVFSVALLFWRYGQQAWAALRQHIEQTLPTMSGETLLFLAAGVLAAGLGAGLQAAEFSLQLETFGPWQAWLLLLALVAISGLGVHPVISIATAGGLFSPWVSDPNLLGLVFLMAWALGVSLSPLSGTHLAMQGRYGISSYAFTRWNLGYVGLLLLVQLAALHLYVALN